MTENIQALVKYRLEQAEESVQAARVLPEKGHVRSAVNRCYYAMFYCVLALLATQQKETSKHSGAIALFDVEFVKKGIFQRKLSRWLHEAFDLRQRCDYMGKLSVSSEEARESLANASSFFERVQRHLEDQGRDAET